MPITKLVEYANRETIETLEGLLKQARQGEIKGLLFAVRLGIKRHAMGVSGEYAIDPIMAAAVTSRILYKLHTLADGHQSSLIAGS